MNHFPFISHSFADKNGLKFLDFKTFFSRNAAKKNQPHVQTVTQQYTKIEKKKYRNI
jgi:hypothetical protein